MSSSLLQKNVEFDNQKENISKFKPNQTIENPVKSPINSKENKSNNDKHFSSPKLFDNTDFTDFKILSSEDFLNIGIMSITDLIDYISGVNIIHRGATESQPTIKYRGSSSSHFVFLIDGVQSFHSNIIFDNLNFPFDNDDLDYVEINTSPSSHKYGFSSSGVILNFVLKSMIHLQLNLILRQEIIILIQSYT